MSNTLRRRWKSTDRHLLFETDHRSSRFAVPAPAIVAASAAPAPAIVAASAAPAIVAASAAPAPAIVAASAAPTQAVVAAGSTPVIAASAAPAPAIVTASAAPTQAVVAAGSTPVQVVVAEVTGLPPPGPDFSLSGEPQPPPALVPPVTTGYSSIAPPMHTIPRGSAVNRRYEFDRPRTWGSRYKDAVWFAVFGFAPADTNLVLHEFGKCGEILENVRIREDSDFMYLLFKNIEGQRMAAGKFRTQMNETRVSGVRCVSPKEIHLLYTALRNDTDIESLDAWISLRALAQPEYPDRYSMRTTAVRSVAPPAKSFVSKVLNLFGV